MKSIKSKINSVGKGELSSEDLYKLRKTLTALNPEDDINNILAKIPNKSTTYPSKDSNVNEASALSNAKQVNLIGFTNELQYTKNQSINEFSSLISTKTDSEIRQILPQKLNEYQQRVQLIIDKSDQQYNTYIQQLSSSKEKNNELQVQITKMRNEENKLAELIGMNTGSGTFTMLTPSSKVWNNEATEFLYKFANNPTKSLLEKLGESTNSIAQNITTVNNTSEYNINIQKGAVVVQGNADKKVLDNATKDLAYNLLTEFKKLK